MESQYISIKHQWDPVANDNPFPGDPYKDKHIVGKWRCEKGHFWYETIENRAHYQICHMCHSHKRATETYNLFYLRPDIAAIWHPIKNKGLTPEDFTPGSSKKVWWFCENEHEWDAIVSNITRGHGCPECANRRVGKDNNLAVLYPDIAKQLHPTLNGTLTAHDITPGSNKKVWWFCENEHEWDASTKSRALQGSNCPECKNINIIRSHTEKHKKNIFHVKGIGLSNHLLKEWHPTKNGLLNPLILSAGSGIKVWWFCEKEHEWEARVYLRVKGHGCPECSNQKVGKDNNLAVLFPDIAKQLHPTLNGDVTAYDILPGSKKKFVWQCESKEHIWKAQVCLRTLRGYGCPECANKRIGMDNNLAVLFPNIAKQLHPTLNGTLTAYEILPGSNKKVWWFCENEHEWETKVYIRVKGHGCPECLNMKVGKDNNLAVLRSDLLVEWDQEKNGSLTPRDVTPGSHKIVNWKCNKAGHEWKAEVRHRAIKNYGCAKCYSERRKRTA